MKWQGMHAATGRAVTDRDHVRQSVRDVLLTPVGSRIARRDYGSAVASMIDWPANAHLRMQLMAAAHMALTRHEPRIRITAVSFSQDEQHGRWTCDLSVEYLTGPLAGTADTVRTAL
ncbi:GPW/gp25 family protein [Laribacter hongkongensis]|uniref:GPW/gp25 family protein n=1 Tax=Laribacter hongkongensis TaxID=168471 RepID=UPI0003FE8F08|nr:GPW/gp25 family protein [Laribacter hongkongensis]